MKKLRKPSNPNAGATKVVKWCTTHDRRLHYNPSYDTWFSDAKCLGHECVVGHKLVEK